MINNETHKAYFGGGSRLELEVTFNLIGDLILLRRFDESSHLFESALKGLSRVFSPSHIYPFHLHSENKSLLYSKWRFEKLFFSSVSSVFGTNWKVSKIIRFDLSYFSFLKNSNTNIIQFVGVTEQNSLMRFLS